MQQKSQKYILKKVLENLNDKEFNKYKKQILKGMLNTDWPNFKIGSVQMGITGIFHYYHPKKQAPKFFSYIPNAKKMGLKKIKTAKKLYKKNKRKSYYYLGQAFHLLTGLAIPAHSKHIIHFLDSDDLENFLEKKVKENPKIKIKKIKENHSKLFDSLAIVTGNFKVYNNNFWIGLKQKLFNNKKTLTNKELEKQSKIVLNLAGSYGYSLFLLFIEKRKNINHNLRSSSSKP